jgi:short-subunit dehydrogenase
MEVQDKVVTVTGASGGIGLATAKLLTRRGAKVALIARSKDKLSEIEKSLSNSLAVPTDMSKEPDVKKMIKKVREHYGRIDILVNNAGQGYDSRVEKVRVRALRKIFELNFMGPVVAMREVIPIMRLQKAGVIVNISSGTALMHLPGMSPYASLKKALSHVSLTAREELKKDGISVSVVYPFVTDTDFEKNTIKEKRERWSGEDSSKIPRADSPEFVAEKILEAIETGKAEIFAHDWMKESKS